MPCNTQEKYHLIGIGGIGMSGIARILLEKKCAVSGSDLCSSDITENLKQENARIFIGHAEENVPPSATVIFNTDIKENNPEYIAALKWNCRRIHRSEMLADLMNQSNSLAVTGTHGKTSTTALLSWTLFIGGMDPSFCVGGILPVFKSNARLGKGPYFVVEADESDGSFLRYYPFGSIITNIDFDHMDYFKDENHLVQAFQQFISQVKKPEFTFWCGDDKRLRNITKKGVAYGFEADSECRCSRPSQRGWTCFFDLNFDGQLYQDIELGLIGNHNILNATAVFGLALRLGVSEENLRLALKTFGGVGRRLEKKGEYDSILFLDDYAHHPNEISTTLKAIRKAVPERRLVVVFQPHRYTRTKECMKEFGTVFDACDELVLTDIYAAGELPILGINSHRLFAEIQPVSVAASRYVSKEDLVQDLIHSIRPGDVVVTVGAGNITHVGEEILLELKKRYNDEKKSLEVEVER